MTRRQQQKGIAWLVATALLSGLFVSMITAGRLDSLQATISNYLFLGPNTKSSQDIVLVTIDEKSLESRSLSEIGTLQFAKSDYGTVIDKLNYAGAQAIGLDVILSEDTGEEDIAELVEVLERYDNVVIAGLPNLLPLTEFQEVATVGSVQFEPDRDNTVRRQAKVFESDIAKRSFAIEVVNRYLDIPSDKNEWIDGAYRITEDAIRISGTKVDPITIPASADKQLLINFFGPPGSYQQRSFGDVLNGEFEMDLKGKIVLIGEVGTALHDEQFVPISFGEPMPGVEIHANAIQTILTQQFLIPQSEQALIFWVILLTAISLAIFLTLSIPISFTFLILGILISTLVNWIAFEYGRIFNSVYIPLALVSTFLVAYVYRYFTEQRLANETKSAFGRYVSPHVVQQILDNPEQLKLGGQKKQLTILFSDIAGFTSISEQLGAEALVEQLNDYLDKMSDIILKKDGTIDKYIGDAIMAFWNAPTDQEDHAIKACHAAILYRDALIELNKKRVQDNLLPFNARIGLNTGDVVVGNMGSSTRFDYTVIGDSVNLAARLEGVNKPYGTDILISEYTYELAKDEIEVREIDLITVKGKTKPVRIYELLSAKNGLTEAQTKLNVHFSEGLENYRAQKWNEAIAAFNRALDINPDDGPSKLFIDRCNELRETNLPENWDGVFVLKTK